MKKIVLLLTLILGVSLPVKAQLEDVNTWEAFVDSLNTLRTTMLVNSFKTGMRLNIIDLRARLALRCNRNFTYYGRLEHEWVVTDSILGLGHDKFEFSGFGSEAEHNRSITRDQSQAISSIRGNLRSIMQEILTTLGKNHVGIIHDTLLDEITIKYYDNAAPGQPYIVAGLGYLRVRKEGVMMEVGWE